MKCPNCGSERVHYTVHSTSQGASLSNGCCGYILLGPIGLLCSLFGSGTSTQKFWVCDGCGNEFQAQEAAKTEKADRARHQSLSASLETCPENVEELLAQAEANLTQKEKDFEAAFRATRAASSRLKVTQISKYIWNGFAAAVCIAGFVCAMAFPPLAIVGLFLTLLICELASRGERKAMKKYAPEENIDLEAAETKKKQAKVEVAQLKKRIKNKKELQTLDRKLHRDE